MAMTPSILTVSQLNRFIKSYLEQEIGMVHVDGELSNLSKPSSGHLYFTLKDSTAQIRCVFFKNRHFNPLTASLKDGQRIVASGKLSLYEARGDYQLIIDQITEAGIGALYQQFEELKNKLATEGLFHPERKKALPKIPKTIGIITSNSGAAIQDILSTLARRFPLVHILIYPSEVQGTTASQQLIQALQRAHIDNRCDVLILARGGGSIEDLWAFNNEQLARQISASLIPIVSGVGHETDFTIADFVADYRAETPTAAAIAVTPDSADLLAAINNLIGRLQLAMMRQVQIKSSTLNYLMNRISSPGQAISGYWQTLDYLERQLCSTIRQIMNNKQHQLQTYSTQLENQNPLTLMHQVTTRLNQLIVQLNHYMTIKIKHLRYQLNNHLSTLHAVSPLATLDRGYSITSKGSSVIDNAQQVSIGDLVEIRLAKGRLACEVKEINTQLD